MSYKLNIYFLYKTTHSEKDSPFQLKQFSMFPESLLLVWNKINFEDNKSTISLGIKKPMNGLQQGIKMFGTECGGKKT